MYDIHNHILFGVDDGVETLEESIEILEDYKRHGIDFVVFTPHVNHPTVKSDIQKIKQHFQILKEECNRIGIRCELGSELYLKPKFQDFIPILDRFVLVELDTLNYPLYLFDQIFELQLEGYDVILAHVERYSWLENNRHVVRKLKEMNVYFQMNISALDKKNYFIKNDYVDFIATDYHGVKRGKLDWERLKDYKSLIEKGHRILRLAKV